MTDYLSLLTVPTALGYDPRIQLLHEADAVDSLHEAVHNAPRGIYNIAGHGVVFLSQAIRLLGRVPVPLPRPAAEGVATLLRRFGLVDYPADQLAVLMFGRVLATNRARDSFGFDPRFTTAETLDHFARERAPETPSRRAHRTAWERELFEYLSRTTTTRKSV
jgi:UDP-glucose 4-epimerase